VRPRPIVQPRQRFHRAWPRRHTDGFRDDRGLRLEPDATALRRRVQRHGDELLEVTSHPLPARLDRATGNYYAPGDSESMGRFERLRSVPTPKAGRKARISGTDRRSRSHRPVTRRQRSNRNRRWVGTQLHERPVHGVRNRALPRRPRVNAMRIRATECFHPDKRPGALQMVGTDVVQPH
jgi:hypothetical protein